MEKRRVVITGLGTVNPLGNTTAESWAAAKAGKCGIGPITQFDASEFKCKLAAEVKNFDPETVVDKKEARKMARFTLLALGAAAEALTDSGLDLAAEGEHIGVSVSSGIGGLPTIEEQHSRGLEKGNGKGQPLFCPDGHCQHGSGPDRHSLWPQGDVHLPGHGLRGRHQRRGRCFPSHPGWL